MVEVIETFDEDDVLESVWKTLQCGEAMRVFQTYRWCRVAWECFLSKEVENRLWILLWSREGSDDRVIFPFYIDGNETLRFIMDRHSDSCDAVYCGVCNRFLCYKEVVDRILAESRIKRVAFQKMLGCSEALHMFGVLLPHPIIYRDNAYSWIALPQTGNAVMSMSHMKTKDRAVIKSFLRKSEKYEFKIYAKVRDDAFPRQEMLSMRACMLSETKRTMFFLPDTLVNFAERVYCDGLCEIAVLNADNHIQALSFRLLHEERILSWIFLYRDPHLTTLLDARYIQEKAKEGAFLFDFGVGAYGYKLGNFRPEAAITFALHYDKTKLGFLKSVTAMNWRYAKDFLKVFRRK